MQTPRMLGPAAAAGFVVGFHVVWHLSLLTSCHEWSSLQWSQPGVRFELLHSAVVMVVTATLAILPYCWRRPSRLVHMLCWSLVGIDVLLRGADWVVYRSSGLHTNLLVTQHANGAGLQLVLGFIAWWKLALPIAALALTVWVSRRSFASLGRKVVPPERLALFSVALIVILGSGAYAARKPQVEHALTGPEWTLFRSLYVSLRERHCREVQACAERLNELDETVRRKLTRFGLRINPRAMFPLAKTSVYRQKMPFPRSDHFTDRPNVIVIFMESMSSYFLGSYRPERAKSYTPNLDRLAAEATRVSHVYNATTPTSPSLLAGLCSFYPPSDHYNFGQSFFGKMHCVSNALEPYGYKSYFIRGIEKEYANIGPFLASQGFEVRDQPILAKALGEGPQSWGYSDHQLMKYLQQFLEERKPDERFFVGITTVDLHTPFNLNNPPRVAPESEGPLWNIVHSTDEAIGDFWRWFKQSRFKDNTIVVLLGDHAVYPVPEYRLVRPNDFPNSYYDEIAFLIHAPNYRLPRLWQPEIASSVDLVPTLLHLMSVNDPNPFEGESLFDDRSGHTGTLGDQLTILYVNQLDEKGRRISRTLGACDESEPKDSYILTTCDQMAWHRWRMRLLDQGRVWRH